MFVPLWQKSKLSLSRVKAGKKVATKIESGWGRRNQQNFSGRMILFSSAFFGVQVWKCGVNENVLRSRVVTTEWQGFAPKKVTRWKGNCEIDSEERLSRELWETKRFNFARNRKKMSLWNHDKKWHCKTKHYFFSHWLTWFNFVSLHPRSCTNPGLPWF